MQKIILKNFLFIISPSKNKLKVKYLTEEFGSKNLGLLKEKR